MKVYRVHIRGWTASFRYPIFIAGFQPTLPLPPLSTIYGIISAAKGAPVTPHDIGVGYVFESSGEAVDLETIYELSGPLQAKSNVCKRQLLFEPSLYLYFKEKEPASYFKRPHYPLLLGRSTELAMVDEITETELEERENVRLGGTLVPFPEDGVHGLLQALPTHFSSEIPRKAAGTRPFYMVNTFINYRKRPLSFDNEKNWGVWFHGG